MEFILNKTLGINGIDRISFKKIIILESIQALMILLI